MPDENPKDIQARSEGKLRLELLESAANHPIAQALGSGADKYGVRNWRVKEIHIRTYVGALRRHIDAWEAGEDVDPDSGLHPLAHVGATVHVCLDALKHGTLVDDRAFAESTVAGEAVNVVGGAKPKEHYIVDCKGEGITLNKVYSAPKGTVFHNFSYATDAATGFLQCCYENSVVDETCCAAGQLCSGAVKL